MPAGAPKSLHTTYEYSTVEAVWDSDLLYQVVQKEIRKYIEPHSHLLEVGCGNGVFAAEMIKAGYKITGMDASVSAIAMAKKANPGSTFRLTNCMEKGSLGKNKWTAIVSLETLEHLADPQAFLNNAYQALKPGGVLVISTPFHGFWKNLLLSLTNNWDNHFTVDWVGGHIKFFSRRTLDQMLRKAGFTTNHFRTYGRIPPLAKSLISCSRK